MATFTLDEREKVNDRSVVAPSGERHHLVCNICFICAFIHTFEASISHLSCFIAVLLFPQLCTLDAHDKVKFLGHVMCDRGNPPPLVKFTQNSGSRY